MSAEESATNGVVDAEIAMVLRLGAAAAGCSRLDLVDGPGEVNRDDVTVAVPGHEPLAVVAVGGHAAAGDITGTVADVARSVAAIRERTAELDLLRSMLETQQVADEYEQALARLSRATNREQTIQGVADELADRIAPALGASLAWIAVVEDDLLVLTHSSSVKATVVDDWPSAPLEAEIPMAVAVRLQEPVHLPDIDSFDLYPAFRPAAIELGLGSFVAIPFADDASGLRGVLGVGWGSPREAGDVPVLLHRVVDLARITLARATAFEVERDQARILERVVLPSSLPETDHYAVAGRYVAPDLQQRVGGDVYDVVIRSDGAVGVMMADAVGHDLVATRAAARLRHAIGVLLVEGYEPAEVMTAVNRYIGASPSKRLVTCVCLLFAADGSQVTVANAGHPQPLLRSADGTTRFVGPLGESLLGRGAIDYSQETVALGLGDSVLAFTDGLLDRRGQSYLDGERWLLQTVAVGDVEPPHRLLDRLIAEIDEWEPDDDIAVLAVERRATPGQGALEIRERASELRLGEVRDQVAAWAEGQGIEIDDRLPLVVTELVANARDASDPDDVISFTALRSGEAEVVIRVVNPADEFDAAADMPDPAARRGRGLALVDAIASELEIAAADGTVSVTARVGLGSAE